MKRLKNFLENVFCGDRLKSFCEDLFFSFFFGEHLRLCPWSLALASSIPVLGLESVCPRRGCPWPWPRIFFVFLALASDFFCVLGLGLEPCVLDSTSAFYLMFVKKNRQNRKRRKRSGYRKKPSSDWLEKDC